MRVIVGLSVSVLARYRLLIPPHQLAGTCYSFRFVAAIVLWILFSISLIWRSPGCNFSTVSSL